MKFPVQKGLIHRHIQCPVLNEQIDWALLHSTAAQHLRSESPAGSLPAQYDALSAKCPSLYSDNTFLTPICPQDAILYYKLGGLSIG